MSHGKTSDFVSFLLFGFTLPLKMRNFDEAVNYYHKALHLGCCSSPKPASSVFIVSFLTCFTTCSLVSIFNFEHVVVHWGVCLN